MPSIYDMPCPQCQGKITSTARMRDDTQAPTYCENGHEFMRSEAYASLKQDMSNRLRELRDSLDSTPPGPQQEEIKDTIKQVRKDKQMIPQGATTMKIEAATRLKADLDEQYTDESKKLSDEKKNATPERKADINRRQDQIKTYKDDHADPADADHTGMDTKPEAMTIEAASRLLASSTVGEVSKGKYKLKITKDKSNSKDAKFYVNDVLVFHGSAALADEWLQNTTEEKLKREFDRASKNKSN